MALGWHTDDAEAYDNLRKYGNLRLNYPHKQKPQQYLEQHPAPTEGMERIQTFTQAQMIADKLALHDVVYS